MMTRALPLTLLFVACGGVIDNLGEETKSFDAFDSVVVVAESGRVVVTKGGTSGIDVTYVQNNANERWQDSDDGTTLTVEATCADGEVGCSASFRLTVPAGTNVAVTTEDGEIEFAGALSGHLEAQTIGGNLIGGDLGAARISALTNGPVDIRFAERPAEVDIDGGKDALYLEIPAGSYNLALDAGGGTNVDDAIVHDPGSSPITMQSVSSITVSELP